MPKLPCLCVGALKGPGRFCQPFARKTTTWIAIYSTKLLSSFHRMQQASVHSMHGIATEKDIFKESEKTVRVLFVEGQPKSIKIYREQNICGVKEGLAGQAITSAEVSGFSNTMFSHCIIHEQTLCGKCVGHKLCFETSCCSFNQLRVAKSPPGQWIYNSDRIWVRRRNVSNGSSMAELPRSLVSFL